MANGKVYGSPVGYTPPDPQRQQRKAAAADPAEIHRRLDAYERHLVNEHAMVQRARAAVPRPRGSSVTAAPPATRGMPGIDAAIKKAGG